jgi:hypothetical protein
MTDRAALVGHLRRGEWPQAHVLAQADESAFGCWAHGIVHMLERDFDNARYWYRRAGRDYPGDDAAAGEIEALAASDADLGDGVIARFDAARSRDDDRQGPDEPRERPPERSEARAAAPERSTR